VELRIDLMTACVRVCSCEWPRDIHGDWRMDGRKRSRGRA